MWDGSDGCPYRIPMNGLNFGFVRAAADQIMGNDPDMLITALESKGLTPGQRIVLIGGSFGWVAEKFIARGYGPAADGTANGKVAVVDTSTWIQNNKNANAQLTITNADVNASTGRRAIRNLFGSNNATVDWAISEDVLPCLIGTGPTPGGNNEIVPFCQNLRSLANNVAHWVSVGVPVFNDPSTWAGDPRYNWKTLQQWKDWTSPDWVVQRGTATVL
jgi:hypothetical protein